MKTRALLAVAMLAVLVSGCVTPGANSTVSVFQKIPLSESKKVFVSPPVVVEKDMETKKIPDATEKSVANGVYEGVQKNLNSKGLLANRESASLNLDLRVHYINSMFAGVGYPMVTGFIHSGASQLVIVRADLKKDGIVALQIDAFDGSGMVSTSPHLE